MTLAKGIKTRVMGDVMTCHDKRGAERGGGKGSD